MIRTIVAAGLLCGLLCEWRLRASPSETLTPAFEVSLIEADCLSHDLARSLESAGFRLRYLGSLANPQARRSLPSGCWAATGFARGWEGTELTLDLQSPASGTHYVLRRTIGRRSFEIVVTGAGQDLNAIDLDKLKSKQGESLRELMAQKLSLSRDLTSLCAQPTDQHSEELWRLERNASGDSAE